MISLNLVKDNVLSFENTDRMTQSIYNDNDINIIIYNSIIFTQIINEIWDNKSSLL